MNIAEAAVLILGILTCAYGITAIAPAFYGAGLIIMFISLLSLVTS
jgi:hypothetical protein